MRNLELLGHNSFRINGVRVDATAYIANDPETSTTYIAYEDQGYVVVAASNLRLDPPEEFGELGRIKASPIVSFTYLSEPEVACLCTQEGDIWYFSKEHFENKGDAVMISDITVYIDFVILNFLVVL